jgi:hypothetical protein
MRRVHHRLIKKVQKTSRVSYLDLEESNFAKLFEFLSRDPVPLMSGKE